MVNPEVPAEAPSSKSVGILAISMCSLIGGGLIIFDLAKSFVFIYDYMHWNR